MNADAKPYLIGIAGPSCAGKTELSRRLSAVLATRVLPLDAYYIDLANLPLEQRAQNNFDVPTALDHDLFLAHLTALADGGAIERPVYDFATHTRSAATERIEPARYIIVEGLFVLYWEDVRRLFGTRVFVDLDDKTCLDRRIRRDVKERGRTPESVMWQFGETVRPMCEQHIRPTHKFADLVVRGDDPIDRSVAAVMAHIDQNAHRWRQAKSHL